MSTTQTALTEVEPVPEDDDCVSIDLAALGTPVDEMSRAPAKPSLSKPIAIPAADAEPGSPFLRSYPVELDKFGIARDPFLVLLDHFNTVAIASPPLKALGLACDIVRLVPMATTQIVGVAVKATTKVTNAVVCKGRTEMFLRDANRDLFGPRGLEVHVAQLDALARITGMPILDDSGNVVSFGRGANILGALDDTNGPWMDAQERRLRALGPYISPLELAVLPREAPDTAWKKVCAMFSELQKMRSKRKLVRQRARASRVNRKVDAVESVHHGRSAHKDEMRYAVLRSMGIDQNRTDGHGMIQPMVMNRIVGRHGSKAERLRARGDKEEGLVHKIHFLFITEKNALGAIGQD